MPAIVRVGPAGWSYRDWEGSVYPSPRPRGFDPLEFLAGTFDAIEINSTFYAPCRAEVARRWIGRVAANPHFRFTVKLWQRFTHDRAAPAPADLAEWKRGVEPLQEAGLLGALLVQFPWSFKNEDDARRRLIEVLDHFREFRLVLEVRHRSWNQPGLLDFLKDQDVTFCNIDQPVIGASLPLTAHVTSTLGYWRLHGRNYKTWFQEDAGRDARYNYLYSEEEIDEIASLVRNVTHLATEIYVVTNNHFEGRAVQNARQLQSKIGDWGSE